MKRWLLIAVVSWTALACSQNAPSQSEFTSLPGFNERVRVLELYPNVTATIVEPANLDRSKRIDLILYALPNGNTTAQTMGRKLVEGLDWHYDIQHIAAQTRALRSRGMKQAVLVYLEADSKSWPQWRSSRGYERANKRIVALVSEIRRIVGDTTRMNVTLTGHSGGGSFMFGFIEGQDSIPGWLERIAFLDANYNFDARHGPKLVNWLQRNPEHTLVVLAYDDRNITVDGKKVVSDSGGTWRASQRMIGSLKASMPFTTDTLGEFIRYRAPQVELLLHPNPENKILHTVMIGEMNGYMHAVLWRRDGYDESLLKPARAYTAFVADTFALPAATPPSIPARSPHALGGTAFMQTIAHVPRDEREAAVLRELMTGNIPSFLRSPQTVQASITGPDGAKHTVAYEVMPDYLAIGSDEDYVRIPMNPYTAQAFADAYGYVLLTRKMSNDVWAAAKVHADPFPMLENRDSAFTFLKHNQILQEQLARMPRGTFVAGIKKDVVVTNKLQEKPGRVAIYGWHHPDGKPIQSLYTGHVDWYVDYSHGIRPARRWMLVDGVRMPFEKILQDSVLSALLSDEGVIAIPRYEN